MQIINSAKAMQAESRRLRATGKTIGFVPTMGFLHEGHLSLMRLAREKADLLVASIFVNPTQFRPDEDFEQYPRDIRKDQDLLKSVHCDVLYYPTTEEMYPVGYQTYIDVEKIGATFEGASRPGFFRGVATVVTKLFNIVQPNMAVFGQKDAQQAVVIQKLVEDLNLDIEIIVGPIIREPDGLAMSSRNVYLTNQQREDARILFQSLQKAKENMEAGQTRTADILKLVKAEINTVASAQIDYIAMVDPKTFEELKDIQRESLIVLAVKIGTTRLIDNLLVRL